MGWASESFHRDIMDAGIKSGMIASGGMTYHSDSTQRESIYEKESDFDSNSFISEMEEGLPFEDIPKPKEIQQKDINMNTNSIKVSAVKIFDANSEYSRGVYNVKIGEFLTIKSVRLYCNPNSGQLYITMPSTKTSGNRYMSYVDVRSDLYNAILASCIKENNKKVKFVQE